MGPTIGKKGQESRARLLTAATAVFAEQGYHEAKVSTIVAEAGLTQAAFYLYFPGKEAIFTELIALFRSRMYELASEARLPTGLDAQAIPERVQNAMEITFRFLAADPDLARLALFLAPDSEQIHQEMISLVLENLRFEQQTGYLRTTLSLDLVADCLVGIIERLAVHWLFSGKKGPADLAVQAADLILHGILASTSSPISNPKQEEIL